MTFFENKKDMRTYNNAGLMFDYEIMSADASGFRTLEVLLTKLDAHVEVGQSLWTSYTGPTVQYFIFVDDL